MSEVTEKTTGQKALEAYSRYKKLAEDGSFRSQLGKRLGSPEDLRLLPAFYRLFPEVTWLSEQEHQHTRYWQVRVAYIFPWCRHSDAVESTLGSQLAKAGISEARFLQVFRAEYPNDLIQLRRLCQQVEPIVNWEKLGTTLYYWNERSKCDLLEDFFITSHQNTHTK
ncbi:MAG: type I-E CRISPR-associated protein Cse2/CasB [Agitococcus sp.]|jgi:CRISPR system Cascade subunit CasB|nr:type I-E CRISPR-associated protein Cse2/CasB [Agitococcus sp.]MBP8110768.1 type I-E CRISPR-associated protein Cse2/CasB [Agitococcus sp.]